MNFQEFISKIDALTRALQHNLKQQRKEHKVASDNNSAITVDSFANDTGGNRNLPSVMFENG